MTTESLYSSDQLQAALNKAYFYLKFRPRTEQEVRLYLGKKAEKFSWPESIIEAALSSLKENNYINDADFVAWFVEQRSKAKQKSRFALATELMRLGVNKDIVDLYFLENELPEEDLALQALTRRWPRYQYLDRKTRFEKAAAFLSRRGFSFDIIKKTIDKLS